MGFPHQHVDSHVFIFNDPLSVVITEFCCVGVKLKMRYAFFFRMYICNKDAYSFVAATAYSVC